jgi:hypothetical protein
VLRRRHGGSACTGRPTALPPRAPVEARGGLAGGSLIRWAGKPAHGFGCLSNPTHPQPLRREGRGAVADNAHPPPALPGEESQAEGSVFRCIEAIAGWSFL